MPKFTETGKVLGSSEMPSLVLQKTAFSTNQKVLNNHRSTIAGIEKIEDYISDNLKENQDRGNFLEEGIGKWASNRLKCGIEFPEYAHIDEEKKMGASIDAIISSEVGIEIMDPITDQEFTFQGEGILEIKTDYFHHGKPKPEWIIQVHHQMICSFYDWAIIACLDQTGKLRLYPLVKDEEMVKIIIDKASEFWKLIESGEDYPPFEEPKDQAVDLTKTLTDTNQDVDELCGNYMYYKAEARRNEKQAQELKDQVIILFESIGIEHGFTNNYVIKSQDVMRKKRKQIETGEMVPGHVFSIKETSNE